MLRGTERCVTVATMAPRTIRSPARSPRRKAAPEAPEARTVDRDRLVIRGLTPADLAALDRATVEANERIGAVAPGARTSRNGVALGLLREALKAYAAPQGGT
mgnify:CR=1 FL=1